MLIVSDTSPVNYLILIDAIDVLGLLYGRVVLPEAVFTELHRPRAPEPVGQWLSHPPDWLEVHRVAAPDNRERLDPGERDAIALALDLRADIILLDERRGRRAAQARGLAVTGTVGVLEAAAARGLIDLPLALNRLQNTNFRADPELIALVLARAAQQQSPAEIPHEDQPPFA